MKIGNLVFENEVSTANIGEQIVAIIARDEAGNVTRKGARLTVIHDNVAPVLSGVADRVSYLGDEVDYFSGITVSDNHDENIQIQVSAAVDINREGIYPLNYFASDAAGNTTNVSANLHIIKDIGQYRSGRTISNHICGNGLHGEYIKCRSNCTYLCKVFRIVPI